MNDFRQCGQRNDRRRRVLNDDLSSRAEPMASLGGEESSAAATVRTRGARKNESRYAQAASMDAQPRLTDLIPRKPLTLVLLFLAGLLMVAGLEALYAWMPRLARMTTDGRVAAFDLDSEGSLGAWFSSLLLLLASLASLLVWSLRRHKLDDYHGRYRIWFWAACCWFVMSLDEACSLHEGFKELMAHLTGQRLYGDGSLWWVLAYAVVLGTVGMRLLLEMRPCRTSTTLFVLTGVCWLGAIVAQLEIVMPRSGARGVMVEEACEMLGYLMLLLSMTVHARYIILDVQGLLASDAKPKRQRRRVAAKAAQTEGQASSTETPAESRQRLAATARPATSGRQTTTGGRQILRTDPPENPLVGRKLTKAERRAQRRLEKADQDDD